MAEMVGRRRPDSGVSRGRLTLIAVLVLAVLAVLSACAPDTGTAGTGTSPDPRGATATKVFAALRGDGIDLTWSAKPGAEPFVVEWRRSGSPQWNDSLVASTTSARVTGLSPNTMYRFRVRSAASSPATGWSGVASRGYFEPTLPVVTIDTVGRARVLSKQDYVEARMTLDPNGHDVDGYSGVTEIRGRGNSTWTLAKKPYRLKLESKAPLMGMPSDRHWVLLANALDRSQLRNHAAFAFSESTDLSWTPRFRYVELVLNGSYEGVYMIGEHVRVAGDRIDIDEMDDTDIDGDALTGGYVLEFDERLEANREPGFRTARTNTAIVVKDPDPAAPEQMRYARDLIDAVESSLFADDFADPTTGYRAHLDVGSMIDYYLVSELTRQQDAFWSSTFLVKPRNELLRFGPVWDFDNSAGVAPNPFSVASPPTGWNILGRNMSKWMPRVVQDPSFMAELADRWDELKPRFESIVESLDEVQNAIRPAIRTDLARWTTPALLPADEATWIQNWYRTRIAWIDSQLAAH